MKADARTVGELKKLLKDLPDDMKLEGYDDYWVTDGVDISVTLEWDDENSEPPEGFKPSVTIACPDYARITDREW